MFSFRQKILISYLFVFCLFSAVTFPLITHIVRAIATKTMEDRADELIAKIQTAPNDLALIRRLKEQQSLIFFRVSVITEDNQVLYDSHTKHLLGPRFSHEYIVDQPDVWEAFEHGVGYNEDYSELHDQKFSFFAKTFDFHGKTYVIRTAFPSKYFNELTNDLEIGFLLLTIAVLLLFSLMTWLIINHFTKPIQRIINAVLPYQEGKQTTIPEIVMNSNNTNDEFNKLAMTLNSLSNKIQKHIDNLILERNEKEAILETLVEGVIAVDSKMMITYINGMALHFLNMSREQLLGHNYSSTHDSQGYSILTKCQQDKKVCSDTVSFLDGTAGGKIYLDLVAAPIGAGSGAILVMQDQSSHYKMLEMRKDFIANASHELKTPITIIHGFAETLHDNPELPIEMRVDILGKIVRNCTRMTTLIKDLLTLSDVENIPLSRLQKCDLGEIVDGCCTTLMDMFPDTIITIDKPENDDLVLIADPSLMELAVMNLIENAAKYSKRPAKIDIGLKKIGDKIQFVVADHGIGIPPEDLEYIFERFYTVDKAHSQKMGGSGLGLSIVQTIIRKHFGQISIQSEFGKGTTFTILLPCSQ